MTLNPLIRVTHQELIYLATAALCQTTLLMNLHNQICAYGYKNCNNLTVKTCCTCRNRHIFLVYSRSRACAEHLMKLAILPAVYFLVRQCSTKIERKSCHSHVLSTFIGSVECQDVKQSFALPVSQSTTACSLFS